jgi:hypothetical protein
VIRRLLSSLIPLILVLLLGGRSLLAEAEGTPTQRTLFIVLDAVPYGFVEELTEPSREGGALFVDFAPPIALISTFPSTTTIALGEAFEPFGLPRSPGYEARFFDWEKAKVRGGGPLSYFKIEFPWREFFQWSRKGAFRSAVASIRPAKASEKRVKRGVEAFFESQAPNFFAYVETTDTAAHLLGPRSLNRTFERLDAALADARRRHPEIDYRVVVLSDHGIDGGEPLKNVWPELRRRLKEAGMRYSRRLRSPGDVVLTPFGLVSSVEAYTAAESTERVAEVMASVEGVDLCVCRNDPGWTINSRDGLAEIQTRNGGDEWTYRPRTADPLGYAPVLKRLRTRSGDESREWFPDESWLGETVLEHFPDALHRIASGFELVTNPASVICSIAPGYMYGLKKTETAARISKGRLRWTHGALYWEASAGFLLTDSPEALPSAPIRIAEALVPLASPESPRFGSTATPGESVEKVVDGKR